MENFDVLIVYSDKLATSADTFVDGILLPFAKGSKRESYNDVYSYFLEVCSMNNITAAFTTSSDIIGAGRCHSYWLYRTNNWVRVTKPGYSNIIFDKFSPHNKQIKDHRSLLFSSKKIKSFNDPDLFNIFFDKQNTYNKFANFSIPTVTIEKTTHKGVWSALIVLKEIMKTHPHKKDFSNKIILKDRFGAGGINVYKSNFNQITEILGILKKHKTKTFIVQPLISFDRGFKYQKNPVAADVRLIFNGTKIIQTYIRIAKNGEFRCNEHCGGKLIYIPITNIPENILVTSKNIIDTLNIKSSLFSLDFIVSNNGNVYLLEGNTGPGLDWDVSNDDNQAEAKKLIRFVVKQLVVLSRQSKEYKHSYENIVESPIIANPFS